ncbi:PREDICTED: feather keratin B-4-like [Gekko japonicus]|uniref:Feather keratin B-4-like n=1 Tax=Gekko japonicus TaxID=146911 RepID=A0ABM1KE89_GEKJA|nr:PREDICTED: feather keratin B-4-like [Gekko japonicus]
MACCYPPSCAIPSCASSPMLGLGPCGVGSGMLGYGGGMPVSSSSLGITSGANVACVNQIPPSEVVIQPPPYVVTIPGPILAASCEPVAVGGYTPCASGSGSGGLRGICRPRRRYSTCGYPC